MRRVDSHLLAPVSLSTINQGLLSWQWLRADFGNPILMSAVGDVFFEDSQGQVHRLDPGVGSIQFVAERRGLFDDCAGLPANLDEWLLRPVVEKLISKGLMLGPDQCYGFTTLPIFREGSYDAANRYVIGAEEHLRLSSHIIRETQGLADGQSIRLRVVD